MLKGVSYLIIFWSILVALVSSLHIFVSMMEIGSNQAGIEKKRICVLALIFLAVQIGMQVLGLTLTWWVKRVLLIEIVDRVYKMAYLFLLIIIGYSLVVQLKKTDYPEERKNSPLSIGQCALLSFRASSRPLFLGMTMYHYDSVSAYFLIVSLGFLAAAGGFSFGYWNGVRREKTFCAIDGILLLFLVCKGILL